MEGFKSLRRLTGEDGPVSARARQNSGAAGEGWPNKQALWEERRRRACSPLAHRIGSLVKAMTNTAFVVRCGVVMEHAPGTHSPVTWVDCLAVSAFGVFAVDQYDWRGTVVRSENKDELMLHEKPGVVSVQTSPLRRAKPALRHLRAVLNPYQCPVECVAVFSNSRCVLDPALPENILQGMDLRHFMRTRLHRFCSSHSRYLDPERIAAHLQLHSADWGEG